MNYLDILTPEQRLRIIEYASYSVSTLPLAAQGTDDPTFTVGDADFVITDLTGEAWDPANPTVVFVRPAITVQINDEGSGRNLFNRPQRWGARVGEARDPYVLPMPFLVKQTSVVTIPLASQALAGGQAYNVNLCVGGFKIFPEGRTI